ncbi:hypothetical protein FBUS_10435 [Fasciolopsis buskii]|uniref:Uncharacterized protein n=1 Tax=Fasciolopsis buskii TaxID=27845 RepID=A0A8E0VHP1_9TREM|nr:hypothetical protein FBUS_10435 [Fasciolopsis buski]
MPKKTVCKFHEPWKSTAYLDVLKVVMMGTQIQMRNTQGTTMTMTTMMLITVLMWRTKMTMSWTWMAMRLGKMKAETVDQVELTEWIQLWKKSKANPTAPVLPVQTRSLVVLE